MAMRIFIKKTTIFYRSLENPRCKNNFKYRALTCKLSFPSYFCKSKYYCNFEFSKSSQHYGVFVQTRLAKIAQNLPLRSVQNTKESQFSKYCRQPTLDCTTFVHKMKSHLHFLL